MSGQRRHPYSTLERLQRDLKETRRLRSLPFMHTLLKQNSRKADWVDAVILDATAVFEEASNDRDGERSSLLTCHMSLSSALQYLQQLDLQSQSAQRLFAPKQLQRRPVPVTYNELETAPVISLWSTPQTSPRASHELPGDAPIPNAVPEGKWQFQGPGLPPNSPPIEFNKLYEHPSISSISVCSMPSLTSPSVQHRPSIGSESQPSLQDSHGTSRATQYQPYRPPQNLGNNNTRLSTAQTPKHFSLSEKRRRSKAMMDAALMGVES